MDATGPINGTPLAECIEKYDLVNPKSSDAWTAYLAQREATIAHSEDTIGFDGETIHEMVDSAVNDVLGSTTLAEHESSTLQDGIYILTHAVQDSGDASVRATGSAAQKFSLASTPQPIPLRSMCTSRIHHRVRYSSIEFHCNIYYRAYATLTGTELDLSEPDDPRKMHGWRPILGMGLRDNDRKVNISAAQARTVHRMLFGGGSGTSALASRTSVRETLRLLLASVGISLHVGTTASNHRVESHELEWEMLEDKNARWLGQNIRRVAEC
ncbi:hypothetical protein C8R45DRAFT_1218407 [Mycena sanguinolenta]|nr:hypothetical protein C8R45DRAFT_1218407 [Mycena sanguinolenta]